MTRTRLAVALAALLAATTAAATESRRLGTFELGAGPYKPNIDAAFSGGSAPYSEVFGNGRGWMFRVGIARTLLFLEGPFDVGIRSGYFRRSGKGLVVDSTTGAVTRSGDPTTFNIIPTSLTVTYRYDGLADRLSIPFEPYARLALERYNWWATNGSGGSQKNGATNGWSWAAGLAFRLDILDSQAARELDSDFGINHTHLFFDATKTHVDDFGSSKSWDLSDTRWSFAGGLMFSF